MMASNTTFDQFPDIDINGVTMVAVAAWLNRDGTVAQITYEKAGVRRLKG